MKIRITLPPIEVDTANFEKDFDGNLLADADMPRDSEDKDEQHDAVKKAYLDDHSTFVTEDDIDLKGATIEILDPTNNSIGEDDEDD